MSILRIMSYALEPTGPPRMAEVARLIRSQRPDLVFLQNLDTEQLGQLAAETALTPGGEQGRCGFLSRHPLSAVQFVSLCEGGACLRADLDLAGKRLHLFNIRLVLEPALRGQQIARLFDQDLLGATLPCATLVAGDFSLPLWGGGQWLLRRRLTPARHPGWKANYPARFPLWPRDRIYLRGPIRSLAGQVIATAEVRLLSRHLPLITTLELLDTREYLKVPDVAKQQMRPVVG